MLVIELLSEVDPGPKIFEPDGVNDMPAEYDSLPQDQIPRMRGPPEGVVFGRIGYILVDFESGKVWKKTTTQEVSTGWVELGETTGGSIGASYGVGSPEGVKVGVQGSLYSNSDQELWQKASAGTGTTGWVLLIS